MRYRKKPVVIEAMQYHGATNAMEVCDWINDEGGEAYTNVSGVKGIPTLIEIETLEGTMRAEPGDWVIKEPFPTDDRRFYPCKPDIFASTYELAEEKLPRFDPMSDPAYDPDHVTPGGSP